MKIKKVLSGNKTKSKSVISWTSIIEKIQEELIEYRKRKIKPTLRAMFYKLYSLGLLRNTRSDYTTLSERTAIARENWVRQIGEEKERLPANCFLDEIHSVQEIDDVYCSPEEEIKKLTDKLKKVPETYTGLPRWYKQPNYVEIWIEKNAMVAEFQSVLNEERLEVRLVPHGGYVSFTFLNQSVMRFMKKADEGKNIHILYFGDFDPSGEQMFDDIKDRLARIWGLKNGKLTIVTKNKKGEIQKESAPFEFKLERVAITKEQVEEHNLPWEPVDNKMREKLENDSRTPAFTEKYGTVYATELDALPIFIRDEFSSIIIDSVDKYFDQETYDREIEAHKKEHSEEAIRRLVKDIIDELNQELCNSNPDKSARTRKRQSQSGK